MPEVVVGDRMRLRQVLVNLIGNAIKFTPRGEVVMEVVAARASEQGRLMLEFRVTDTGIGIPQDKIVSIFNAFEQGDGSMTRRYGGTGLGLAITSRLIQLMGGKIWVDSRVGKEARSTSRSRSASADPQSVQVSADRAGADRQRQGLDRR